MDAQDVLVCPLEPKDILATAALLAEAMDDDPAYAFLFPKPSERRRGLGDFFARNLRTHLPYRCTSVLTVGGDVAATATLRPPAGIPISLWTMLRRGLIPFAAAHGVSAVQRLLKLKNVYDDARSEPRERRSPLVRAHDGGHAGKAGAGARFTPPRAGARGPSRSGRWANACPDRPGNPSRAQRRLLPTREVRGGGPSRSGPRRGPALPGVVHATPVVAQKEPTSPRPPPPWPRAITLGTTWRPRSFRTSTVRGEARP